MKPKLPSSVLKVIDDFFCVNWSERMITMLFPARF